MPTPESIRTLIPGDKPTALLFPGQGSQHVGMARGLAERYPIAHRVMAEADDTLGFALSQLCYEGPADELTQTINAQPAILAASIAALRVLQQEVGDANNSVDNSVDNSVGAPVDEQPSGLCFVAGHSLGEYTALVAAGSLAFADGLRLVRERGRLMQAAGDHAPGTMAAILGLDEETVADACLRISERGDGLVQIANDNCPGQIVISGERAGVEAAMATLRSAGARKIVPLDVSVASHSPLMQPAVEELRSAVEAALIEKPVVPLLANTTAQPVDDPNAIRDELVDQLTGSVRWTESMQYAVEAGVSHFVEIGPGEVVSGFIKRIERKATRLSVNDPASVEQFVELFAP